MHYTGPHHFSGERPTNPALQSTFQGPVGEFTVKLRRCFVIGGLGRWCLECDPWEGCDPLPPPYGRHMGARKVTGVTRLTALRSVLALIRSIGAGRQVFRGSVVNGLEGVGTRDYVWCGAWNGATGSSGVGDTGDRGSTATGTCRLRSRALDRGFSKRSGRPSARTQRRARPG